MVSMAIASARDVTTFTLSTSVSEWSNGTPLRRVSRRFCRGGRGEGEWETGRGGEGREGKEDRRVESDRRQQNGRRGKEWEANEYEGRQGEG